MKARLWAMTLTLEIVGENLSECFVWSSTYKRSSMRAMTLKARLSRTLE